jgi:hypothetical protein
MKSVREKNTYSRKIGFKGQLISKGLFGIIVSTKKSNNFFKDCYFGQNDDFTKYF